MSRYTKTIEGGKELSWGYDRPLQEYFVQLFCTETEEPIFDCGNVSTTVPHPANEKLRYSNSELLEIMQEFSGHIPEEHLQAVAMDLPF